MQQPEGTSTPVADAEVANKSDESKRSKKKKSKDRESSSEDKPKKSKKSKSKSKSKSKRKKKDKDRAAGDIEAEAEDEVPQTTVVTIEEESAATRKPTRTVFEDGDLPSPCVWVGNCCSSVAPDEFRKEFEKFGEVVLVRLFPRSKCAFVTMRTSQQAINALKMEGKQMGSMNLTLNIGKASRHLWVGNVESNVSEIELRAIFETCGVVESVRILRTNKCAFVNFATENDAVRAAEQLNGAQVGEKKILVNFQWDNAFKKPREKGEEEEIGPDGEPIKKVANPPPQFSPSRQLFVGNLVPSVTEETLWSLFHRFGEIESIKAFSSRGYAFVVFSNERVSTWVKEQMNLYPPILGGRPLVVNFGKRVQERPRNADLVGYDSMMSLLLPDPNMPEGFQNFNGEAPPVVADDAVATEVTPTEAPVVITE